MVYKKGQQISLNADSDRMFFLIHGYTGSPTDFGALPEYLRAHFNASVIIPNLKGHGTYVRDLDTVSYKDFYEQVSEELKAQIKNGKKVIVVGFSFGAELALLLAAKYHVEGVIAVSPSHRLKFPWNVPGLRFARIFKKHWKKKLSVHEQRLRKNSFFYLKMHINALQVCGAASRELRKNLFMITSPVLSLYSKEENLSSLRGMKDLECISSELNQNIIYNTKYHNLFYSPLSKKTVRSIKNFIEENELFNEQEIMNDSVSAIIPSYNEEARIGKVLECLTKVPLLSEIIVVDDGSSDDTKKVVEGFPGVTYMKNEVNMGKGHSMDRGVALAKSNIIFFCDADLRELTPDIVLNIVAPVVREETSMSIGIRKNWMQRAIPLFAVNSGERALSKGMWQKLPDFYKRGYRIESGLNWYAKKYGEGYQYRQFEHEQTLKERKYGFLRGTFLRWKMNMEVLVAYFGCLFMPFLLKKQVVNGAREKAHLQTQKSEEIFFHWQPRDLLRQSTKK